MYLYSTVIIINTQEFVVIMNIQDLFGQSITINDYPLKELFIDYCTVIFNYFIPSLITCSVDLIERQIPLIEKSSDDLSSVVFAAERLKESFESLLFLMVSVIGQANINLVWLKLRINLFLQYAREVTPEVKSILDDLEVHGHSPEGVVFFLVNRNLLGYLNFELLNVFMKFLEGNNTVNSKFADYRLKHKAFINQNLKNIVHVFRENPRLAPASVVGLPTIKVHLTEPWQGKSYYQWKEIMENIVDWPDHLLIKSIDINCVIITYHVLPFILCRVVNDLTNETIIRRFSAVGATFTISSEVLELARTDSEWISSIIEQATALEKMKLSSGTSEDVVLEKENPLEQKSDIDQVHCTCTLYMYYTCTEMIVICLHVFAINTTPL